ncbi:zinc carboxypeptidase [Leptospira inadai serovar Lyme str. 10]|uniref:Zinc carboxypeptidase n=2 Tax=Leptospira inadai serovar Lyme TaxID=293084 RepID=V6HEN8_9LEPT|nr:M14 family zinc carboxypeptidase [Leptospira inadai]EQA38881.1 zinc carboxypeptidase [Leptospira inadai serovar Lyme str. 10]PNV72276.1 peptidase M14 [Leptospira inadai serovar Lyme]
MPPVHLPLRFRLFLIPFGCSILFSFVSCLYRTTIPARPLNDSGKTALLRVDRGAKEEFLRITDYRVPFTFEEKDSYYAVLSRTALKQYGFPKSGISIVNKYPFKYYSGNYQDLINESIFALGDVKKGYKDDSLNFHYLYWTTKLFPGQASFEVIGKSARGSDIFAILLTDTRLSDDGKVSVLFNCAHHSNEVISVEHCYDVIYGILSSKKEYADALSKLKIWVVPIVNPDGAKVFWHDTIAMGRKNGAPGYGPILEKDNPGVDINRNYPFFWGKTNSNQTSSIPASTFYRGPGPASEPETKAMIALAEKERFVGSISYHAYANCILVPYSIDDTKNPDPDLTWDLGKRIASEIRSYNPDKSFQARKNIYGVDGVDQDYFFFKYGTLAYLLETSHSNPPYSDVPKIVESMRPAWTLLLEEILEGNKIFFRIRDESGHPLSVNVIYENQTFFQNETRSSRPRDGLFFQSFPSLRKIRIRLERDGYETLYWEGPTWKSWKAVDLVLKKLR